MEARLTWQKRAQKAAGELYLSVEQDQKSHIYGMLTDPIRIWSTVCNVHISKKPRARFHAYDELPSTTNEPETKTVTESAGNASVNHISSSPLQNNASFDWNADSGTTSHMTPHAHWIRNYMLFQTLIHLANDLIIYSTGIGSIVFVPSIRGKEGRAVELTQVLHVPELRTNLLSILYLTRHKQFTVQIDACKMQFICDRTLLFTAQINGNNAAFLDGTTDANLESAHLMSTLPLNSIITLLTTTIMRSSI